MAAPEELPSPKRALYIALLCAALMLMWRWEDASGILSSTPALSGLGEQLNARACQAAIHSDHISAHAAAVSVVGRRCSHLVR